MRCVNRANDLFTRNESSGGREWVAGRVAHCRNIDSRREVGMVAPTIVLVQGALGDASGFRPLYDLLLGEDLTIIAPPNPLRGLTGGDGAYLKQVVSEIDGPVLLVGHSYGGSVITAAGTADNVV